MCSCFPTRWLTGHLFNSAHRPHVPPVFSPLKRSVRALLVAYAATFSSVVAQPPDTHSRHTRVSLVADVRGIVPGGSFTLGVLMKMDPGWHTYWKNPGDAGLATQIVWNNPDGFVAGSIRWPLPHKYSDSGDILSYGYAKENMLLVPLTAPASLAPGTTVTLKANVTWLECDKICVPGESAIAITLPVLKGSPAPDNAGLFASYSGQIPPQWGGEKDIALDAAPGKGRLEIKLSATGEVTFVPSGPFSPDFYPEESGDIIAGRTVASAAPKVISMTVPLTASQPVSQAVTVRGVILFTETPGVLHTASISVSIPPESLALGGPSGNSGNPGVSLLERHFELSRSPGGAQPLLLYIFFAFVGGLLLNVMPCVLPVIALKVFGLVKMAGDRPGRIKGLGLSFAAGILASFLGLALVVIILQAAGQQVGWGFQFQEPRFVIAMAAIVFAFGLSLFGVFEINLPGGVVTGISSAVTHRQGNTYAASFGEGIFATVLATPCTAPFLGSALGFAFAQPWWIILLIFTCVAIGMALPYVVLTAKPAWIRFLPKPGAWMVGAQQLMGFLMMATLLWLLYVLGKQMGMEAVIWTGAFLLAVGLACWLIGKFATLTASRRTYWLTWIAAALIVAGGYLLFLVSALDITTALAVESSGTPAPAAPGGIEWKQFSLAGLEEDLKGDRPVFLDFTAEWCLTCKVNEKTVLSTQEVTGKFHALNVLAVRADWTNRNPDITRLLSKFGRSGVPLYVIFPPGKSGSPIVLPEVITSGIVLDALERAK
jgi:thiol:disulfide interchange protein/DsbC/DsbD-like thiol-disulfide interchange protein